MYTPEIVGAYLNNQIMLGFSASHRTIFDAFDQISDFTIRDRWKCFSYFIKPLFYHEQWPELPHRKKFTGFEFVGESWDKWVEQINAIHHQQFGESIDRYRNMINVSVDELRDHLINGGGVNRIWYGRPPPRS
jgi:hypothetical protein